jgi:2-hydroxychromene-2-carboxylate isomerase/predicted thioesterase
MRALPLGQQVCVHTTTPDETNTAAAIGNTGIAVVSTPHVIALLEEASHRCVRAYFEEGEASVGTRVNVAHLAPAYAGKPVQARATLTQVNGRRLSFDVVAEQAGTVVMTGSHERALVRTEKFQAPLASKASEGSADALQSSTPDKPIDFFFDYHSPWCYLAAEQIAGVARDAGRPLRWRPFHLAQLIERIDGRRPLDANAAFVRWFRQDMQDCAAVQGLTLRYHPDFPLRPVRALRASAYAQDQGLAEPFVRAMMKAYWCDGGDISDPGFIGQVAADVGLNVEGIQAACAAPHYKRVIEDNTHTAIEVGIFGAPSFIADGQLFWGNDRIDMLARYLRGGLASRA